MGMGGRKPRAGQRCVPLHLAKEDVGRVAAREDGCRRGARLLERGGKDHAEEQRGGGGERSHRRTHAHASGSSVSSGNFARLRLIENFMRALVITYSAS